MKDKQTKVTLCPYSFRDASKDQFWQAAWINSKWRQLELVLDYCLPEKTVFGTSIIQFYGATLHIVPNKTDWAN